MTGDRGPTAPSRSINLSQGAGSDTWGSLRWCDDPGCPITYTTAERCRHCHRQTLESHRERGDDRD